MKRYSRQKRLFRRVAVLIFLVVSAGLAAFGGYQYRIERELRTQADSRRAEGSGGTETAKETSRFFDQDTVSHNGKRYRRNTYIKAILCMGVDRDGDMSETKTAGSGGQSDGILLAAHDTAHDSLSLLMIPRDTMTPITLTDLSGNVLGKDIQHLTLAYAYGDGREKSCEYMAEAVSDLLLGLSIDHYLAADMSVISVVNDLVGGVTVTVPTEGMEKADPAFVYGSQVTLHGSQAEKFVRYRDIERDHSALYRMDQQQEYIEQLIVTVREQSKQDDGLVARLFEGIQENMVTDMEKSEYLKAAMSGLTGDSSLPRIYTLPGTGVTTEKYDEFYPDEEGLKDVVLRLFYREEG